MLGGNDGKHWGSGDEYRMTPGIQGERLDKVRGAGVQA
jgi:hypothetical protein